MELRKLISYVLIVAGICLMAVGCSGRGNRSELAELDHKANLSMSSNDKEGLDSLASLLLEKAREHHEEILEGKAHFYLSSFSQNLPEDVTRIKLRHLDKAQEIAEKNNNDSLLTFVYNQRGVWELGQYRHAVTAQYWFAKSMEHASRLDSRALSIPAEMNMSEACRIAGDTIGINYDLRLFDYASQQKEPLLRFVAGMHCAMYYAPLVADTAELQPYVRAMRSMEKEYPGASEYVYAIFYFSHADYEKAESSPGLLPQ